MKTTRFLAGALTLGLGVVALPSLAEARHIHIRRHCAPRVRISLGVRPIYQAPVYSGGYYDYEPYYDDYGYQTYEPYYYGDYGYSYGYSYHPRVRYRGSYSPRYYYRGGGYRSYDGRGSRGYRDGGRFRGGYDRRDGGRFRDGGRQHDGRGRR